MNDWLMENKLMLNNDKNPQQFEVKINNVNIET